MQKKLPAVFSRIRSALAATPDCTAIRRRRAAGAACRALVLSPVNDAMLAVLLCVMVRSLQALIRAMAATIVLGMMRVALRAFNS